MRDKILNKARELFLNLGFKSVTMDDIANSLGISKKTLYVHFKNKTTLVAAVSLSVFEIISEGINCICKKEENPIEEIFEIKKFVLNVLNDEKSSPQYQLQKYYPQIYTSLKEKQFEVMQDCVKQNLQKGITQGLYRKNLDIDFISRIYFFGIVSIKDKSLFPAEHLSMSQLMNLYLDYHLRGICTEKGIYLLENQLKKQNL